MQLKRLIEIGIDARKAKEGAAEFEKSMDKVAGSSKLTRNELGQFKRKFDELGATGGFVARALAGAFASFAAYFSTKFIVSQLTEVQDSLISLENTTNKTGKELENLSSIVVGLAARSTSGISAIVELTNAASQLGVRAIPDMLKFVDTMDKIGKVTDIQGAAGARSLGQLLRVSEESTKNLALLGGTINALADEFGGSESAILGTATSIQLLNERFGLTSRQSLAISAVLSRLGSEGGMASMVITKLFNALDETFVKQFGGDRVQALIAVLAQLNDLKDSTKEFEAALKSLGVEDRRSIRSVIPLISGYRELEKAMKIAEDTQSNLNDLDAESAKVKGSISNEMKKLSSTLAAVVGSEQGVASALSSVISTGSKTVRLIFNLDDANDRASMSAQILAKSLIFATTASAAFVAIKGAAYVWSMREAFLGAAVGVRTFTAALARNPIGLAAVAIAGLATVLVDFEDTVSDAESSLSSLGQSTVLELRRAQEQAAKTVLSAKRALEVGDQDAYKSSLRERIGLLTDYSLKLRDAGQQAGVLSDLDPLLADSEEFQRAKSSLTTYFESLKSQMRNASSEAEKFNLIKKLSSGDINDPKVKNALDMVEREIKRLKALVDGPKMEFVKIDTTDIDKRMKSLRDEIALIEKYGTDSEKISAEKERQRAITDAQSEAEKTYGGHLLPVMTYVASLTKMYDQLVAARKRVAEEAKQSLLQKEMTTSLDTMKKDLALTLSFKGTMEELSDVRERQAAIIEVQKKAEEAYGGRLLPVMNAVAEFAKIYDDLFAARKRIADQTQQKQKDDEIGKTIQQQIEAAKIELMLIGKTNDERERAQTIAELDARIAEASIEKQSELNAKKEEYLSLQKDINTATNVQRMKDMTDQLNNQIALYGKSNVERRHAAEITEYQSYAEKAFGKNVQEASKALAEFIKLIERSDYMDQMQQMADRMGDTFGSAFESMIFDAKSFKDAMEGMVKDISRIIFNQMVTRQLATWSSGFFSSLFVPSASGNVFNHGDVVPFADGGVVNRPSVFPMRGGKTGLMGEAGPEAILPLTRVNGKLGVQSNGSSSTVNNVTFHINTPDADSFRRSEKQIQRRMIGTLRRSR